MSNEDRDPQAFADLLSGEVTRLWDRECQGKLDVLETSLELLEEAANGVLPGLRQEVAAKLSDMQSSFDEAIGDLVGSLEGLTGSVSNLVQVLDEHVPTTLESGGDKIVAALDDAETTLDEGYVAQISTLATAQLDRARQSVQDGRSLVEEELQLLGGEVQELLGGLVTRFQELRSDWTSVAEEAKQEFTDLYGDLASLGEDVVTLKDAVISCLSLTGAGLNSAANGCYVAQSVLQDVH